MTVAQYLFSCVPLKTTTMAFISLAKPTYACLYSLKHNEYTIGQGIMVRITQVEKNLQAVLDIYDDLYHLEPLGHPIKFHDPSPTLQWGNKAQNAHEW